MVILSGCIKIGEYYAGMNLQPELRNNDAVEGLNVFGVLKSGPSLDTACCFFEVQQLLFIHGNYDSICINEAEINLTRKTASGEITNYKLNSKDDCSYYNQNLKTEYGDKWNFICTYDTFEVYSECIIPEKPIIKEIQINDISNIISFSVVFDSTASMYYAYLISADSFYIEKRVPEKGIDTKFSINPQWDIEDKSISLFLFAYDKNLEQYQTTSNIFFKPNAYRPCYTTVEGGYGTFGAISSTYLLLR
jgi:hypothetical protein